MSLKSFATQLINSIQHHDIFVDVNIRQNRKRVLDFLTAVNRFSDKPTYYGLSNRAVIYVPKAFMAKLPADGLDQFTDNLKLVRNMTNSYYYLMLTNKGMALKYTQYAELEDNEHDLVAKLVDLYLDIDRKLGKSDRKRLRLMREQLASQLYRKQVAYIAPTQPIYRSFLNHMLDESNATPESLGIIQVRQHGDSLMLSSGDTKVLL